MAETSDALARQRILNELDTTLMVEAGAGSGKTTSLVGRMVALIRTGAAEIGRIAAITFTNKAADELKERFRLELERALRTSAAETAERSRFETALEQLEQIFIGTIHSFCGGMLRERPVEAGLDPAFIELDEDAEIEFRQRCWDDYLQLQEERGEAQELQELLAYGLDVNTLKNVYERVSLFSDVRVMMEERPRPDFDLIRWSLPPLLEAAFRYIPSSEPERGWDGLQRAVRTAKQRERLFGWADEKDVLRTAFEFEKKLPVTLNRWTDANQARELRERFDDWQRTVLFPFLQAWREYLYPRLIRFVQPAVRYCESRRLELGLLNFQDLLMKATALLREGPQVRRYFANRYQRLLVDEFQDTDPVQAEMLFLLTGCSADDAERDWRRLTPRAGSLFIVGDPKQSIYRFRRADITIYNEVKHRIALCGDVLQLNANFRCVHALGEFVNGQFASRFPGSATDEQAAFIAMETQTANPEADKRPLHGLYTLSYPKIAGGKEAAARADAQRVAQVIAWACVSGNLQLQERAPYGEPAWVLRDAAPGDFLILLKNKEFLHLYAEALDSLGIPADTAGSSAMYSEIGALSQLASCLADPSDKVALLGVLRGELFGISDRELFAYKREGHSFTYRVPPKQEDCGEDAAAVLTALMTLRKYNGWVRRLPAMSALYQIVEDLGLLPGAFMRQAASTRAGTLIKLLQLLQEQLRTAASWTELAAALRKLCERGGLETSSLYAGGGQAVRIMNLHKAKGLEAPVVFLACPCGESDHDAAQYIDRSGDPAAGYFTITRRKHEFAEEIVAQPVGWEAMSVRERGFMNAEKERLLYVAATRAKQLMVVSLCPDQPAKCPWSSLTAGMEVAPLELEVEAVEQHAAPAPVYTGEPDLAGLRAKRAASVERAARPTFARLSVTRQTKMAGEQPEWSSEGRGPAFGSLVHQGIEAMGKGMRGEKLRDFLRMLAAREGMADEAAGQALFMLLQLECSELWQRALSAGRRLHEVPLMVRKAPEEVSALAEGGHPGDIEVATASEAGGSAASPSGCAQSVQSVFVKGVIDFLFEEEDGWVLVDFKTDLFQPEQRESFVRFYKPQVTAYAREWEKTFGYRVKESGLYFINVQEYVRL